jgi:hypothetical protein
MWSARIRRGTEADLALLPANCMDSCVSIRIRLHHPIFKKRDRAVRENVDAVLIEVIQAMFMLNRGKVDRERLIGTKGRG